VAVLKAVQARGAGRRSGVDVAVEGLVALAQLLPLPHGKAIAVPAGDQLLGAELLEEFGVDMRQMDKAAREYWSRGFCRTMEQHATDAWPLVMTQIAEATGEGLETVRDFLDSRYGRHFADDVGNELDPGRPVADAVDAATQRWMGWTIGRQASKEYGIPRGLPYLTGFAIHAGIMAEEEAV
jgi:hypothetical protein